MSEQELTIIQGTIAAVIYQNYDNGYSVLRLRAENGETVTVVGTIPLPAVGERLMVTGRWTSHQSYGKQFEAEFLERLLPQYASEILSYLAGHAIKGIGPKLAARIVDQFGDETLQIMERQPERLTEVPGISLQRARAIGQEFMLRVGLRHIMEFFTLHQLPPDLAVRAYKRYGEQTMDMVYDDPYLLMEEGLDAPFGAVDRFAVELGVLAGDRRRLEAGLVFELTYNLSAGHTFLPREKLIGATAQLLSVDTASVTEALESLVRCEQLAEDHFAGISVVYLRRIYVAEQYATLRLLQLADTAFPTEGKLKKMLATAARQSGVSYSEQQTEAIRTAADTGLLLLTGGPGTGKTTVLKGILSLYEQMGLSCVLAAPTGRAAKRLTEVTGAEASTIHRLLEATIDPTTGKMCFLRDEQSPLEADAVIVDEMSMVDIELLESLLRAVGPDTRVVMVGDPDQLPPVGPGCPFSDMLRSGMIKTVRLTEIFRQARESLIVMNAHRINQGQMPDLKTRNSDFFFIPCRSEQELSDLVTDLCQRRLPQNMGIPADQIQVITPTRKGGVGTVALNRRLQERLNPASPQKNERQFGDTVFRVGDRVMQIRNNYDMTWYKLDGSGVGTGVFNGDVGVIHSVDPALEQLTVIFDDRQAAYDFDQLNELEPAYAMTVHKSQGSEYRCVVIAAWNGSPYLLNRSILYTAVTRARELLVVAGSEQTVAAMTENANTLKRYSGLKLRLQGKA